MYNFKLIFISYSDGARVLKELYWFQSVNINFVLLFYYVTFEYLYANSTECKMHFV